MKFKKEIIKSINLFVIIIKPLKIYNKNSNNLLSLIIKNLNI